MRITKVVALLLACVLLFGGCSLISIDDERVSNQVVAKVNGMKIYKYEIDEADVLSTVQQQLYYAQQFGLNYTQDQIDELIVNTREDALKNRVEKEVLLSKADELNITLSEEEKSQCMIDAQENLDYIKNEFIGQVEQEKAAAEEAVAAATDDTAEAVDDSAETPAEDTDVTDPEVLAEATTRYQNYLDVTGTTLESVYEQICESDLLEKVKGYTYSFAQVTDEQVKNWYDQTLALQQEEMDAAAGVFEEKISGSKIYTYVPERIVAVSDILIAFDDTLSADLKTAYDQDSTSQYDALINAALSEFADYIVSATQIKSRLDGGEEVADIVEELSEHMDNISNSTPSFGVIVDPRTEAYSENFVKAATSLEAIGDSSEPFADYEGIHVLQLMEVYEQGVVPFEDLADSIKKALQPGAEEDMYNQMLEEWLEEAGATYYFDILNSNND